MRKKLYNIGFLKLIEVNTALTKYQFGLSTGKYRLSYQELNKLNLKIKDINTLLQDRGY